MIFINWMQTHLYTTLFIAWVVSNFVSAMPSPTINSSQFYVWFFGAMHATFGALPRLIMTLLPNTWLSKLIPGANGEPKIGLGGQVVIPPAVEPKVVIVAQEPPKVEVKQEPKL